MNNLKPSLITLDSKSACSSVHTGRVSHASGPQHWVKCEVNSPFTDDRSFCRSARHSARRKHFEQYERTCDADYVSTILFSDVFFEKRYVTQCHYENLLQQQHEERKRLHNLERDRCKSLILRHLLGGFSPHSGVDRPGKKPLKKRNVIDVSSRRSFVRVLRRVYVAYGDGQYTLLFAKNLNMTVNEASRHMSHHDRTEEWSTHCKKLKTIKRMRVVHTYKVVTPICPQGILVGESDKLFEPHFGLELSDYYEILSELTNITGDNVTDELLSHVEGLGLLFLTLQSTPTVSAACAAVGLYLKSHLKTSICRQVIKYMKDVIDVKPQSGLETSSGHVLDGTDWVDSMRNMRNHWQFVKENKAFGHISKLLGLVVFANLCTESQLTFDVGIFGTIAPDLQVVHGKAVDVIDAALSTVAYFVETGHACWTRGSLVPLLRGEAEALELDEEYARVITQWNCVKSGNLMKVMNMHEADFDKRLDDLTNRMKNVLTGLKGIEKSVMNNKFLNLLNIRNDYVTMKVGSDLRPAPFAIELFGKSNQGKTTCGQQIVHGLLASQKMDTSKDRQISLNLADKFWSTYKTDHLVVTVDDIGNENSNYVEKPPTRAIIDLVNNQPYYANMADISEKGKVFVEPKIVLVTTNVKDLDARTYSNCPYSIQRRMNVVITVRAKDEFQRFDSKGNPCGIDSKKVFAKQGSDVPQFDDIWLLTAQIAIEPKKMTSTASYENLVYNGKPLVDVSLATMINFLIDEFDTHLRHQESIMNRKKSREQEWELCGVDGCRQIRGYCMKHTLAQSVACSTMNKPHFGKEIANALEYADNRITNMFIGDSNLFSRKVEHLSCSAILAGTTLFCRKWDWLAVFPSSWIQNKSFQKLCLAMNQDRLRQRFLSRTFGLIGGTAAACLTTWRSYGRNSLPMCLTWLAGAAMIQSVQVQVVKDGFIEEMAQRNDCIDATIKGVREKHAGTVLKASAIIATIYAVSKVYRAWKKTYVPQSRLEPENEAEIKQRDVSPNPWIGPGISHLRVSDNAVNTTSKQLRGMVKKNLFYGSVKRPNGNLAVNGLFLKSNIVVIPAHYFDDSETLEIEFSKGGWVHGSKHWTKLSYCLSEQVPDSDLRICFTPNGGDFSDLTRYLPVDSLRAFDFTMLYRHKDGRLSEMKGLANAGRVGHSLATFEGYSYTNLSQNTFEGMCGAVGISDKKPLITGFHLGGAAGTPRGCSGTLMKVDAERIIAKIAELPTVVITPESSEFLPHAMGKKVLTDEPMHFKSPMRYIEGHSQLEWIGSCIGASTFKSTARPTLITEHVMDVMGAPNIYCAPIENPQYEPWQVCMQNLARPGMAFDPGLLTVAYNDFVSDLKPIFSLEYNQTRPLTDVENWNGIPGKKFIDRIKLNTAIGFPLTGKKENYVLEVEPFGEYAKIVEPMPEIKQAILTAAWALSNGRRANLVAKACKKDEVLSKRKNRIFYSNPIALTFLVRKYFLPIIRILQLYPLISECAVGVNSHGPEWQELHDHIFKHGADRLFGGDYGKYDQKLPSQLLLAAFDALIEFGRAAGYSESDVAMMRAIAGEIVYARVAFNGDLVTLTEGTHISGNSLTVILNGICGSLNLRCYYYSTRCSEHKFRNDVSLMTYGDDNIGSVRPGVVDFTIKGAAEFLAEHGQIYTMPDKESELQDFLPEEEFEFLKRKSVFHPSLGVHLGALVDKSCFKMLHYHLWDKRSPLTQEHACALNIDTACREWFNHGEEVYEMRREQLSQVAARSDLSHLCCELNKSYQDRAQEWMETYSSDSERVRAPTSLI